MKTVIGITQQPTKIQDLFSEYMGVTGSLTEVGPFISKEEVLSWMEYLKSKIGDIEEIGIDKESTTEAVWYGFTFEQAPPE